MFKTKTIEFESDTMVIIRRKESNKEEAIKNIQLYTLMGFKITGIASGMNPNDHMIYMQKV